MQIFFKKGALGTDKVIITDKGGWGGWWRRVCEMVRILQNLLVRIVIEKNLQSELNLTTSRVSQGRISVR